MVVATKSWVRPDFGGRSSRITTERDDPGVTSTSLGARLPAGRLDGDGVLADRHGLGVGADGDQPLVDEDARVARLGDHPSWPFSGSAGVEA
jgi:hypothetical protein